MKKIYSTVLLLSSMALSTTMIAQREEIVNGGFETGSMDGWIDVTNTNTAVVEAASKKNGSYGFTWARAQQNSVRRGQVVSVTPGKTYTFKMWYKINGGTGESVEANVKDAFTGFYFYNSTTETFTPTADYAKAEPAENTDLAIKHKWGPSNLTTVGVALPATEWTEFTKTITIPAGVDKGFIELFWHRTTLYIDDVSFVDPTGVPAKINRNKAITLAVTPTLATTTINIVAPESIVEYSIFDITGKLVLTGNGNNSNSVSDIQVGALTKGMYVISTKTTSGVATAKFTKN